VSRITSDRSFPGYLSSRSGYAGMNAGESTMRNADLSSHSLRWAEIDDRARADRLRLEQLERVLAPGTTGLVSRIKSWLLHWGDRLFGAGGRPAVG
jgi:hypothetical protein